jgi:hypothetical protein
MVTELNNKIPYRIRITAVEVTPLELGNLTAFLYDLVLLHDRLLLILSDEYEYERHLTFFFYRRIGRPIRKPDRLQVKLITKQSPLAIELIIPATIAVAGLGWTLVQIIEKLADWKEDRAIKRLQRQNLELDAECKKRELQQLISENIRPKLLQKYRGDAEAIEERVVRDAIRLGTNEQVAVDKVETVETAEDQHS